MITVVCELASTCPYFNDQIDMKPQMAALFKAKYCRGEHVECARYLVFLALGRESIPVDLNPNDRLRALRMVRADAPHTPDPASKAK